MPRASLDKTHIQPVKLYQWGVSQNAAPMCADPSAKRGGALTLESVRPFGQNWARQLGSCLRAGAERAPPITAAGRA